MRYMKFFTGCKHVLSMILHLTGSCPTNAIVSDFFGDISISKFFAMFCNVNTHFVNCPLN